MSTISNFKAYLTDTGNILFQHNSKWFFAEPSGKILRRVSNQESEYLQGICPEILFKGTIDVPEIEYWKYLFSADMIDDRDFYWALSSNGGKYSNTDRYNYFARINGGKVEFLCLIKSFSSSEFSQTWNGRYQSNLCSIYLIDVDDDWSLLEYGHEDSEASIQQFGELCEWKDLFWPTNYTSSNYDQETGCYTGESETSEINLSFVEYLSRWRKICSVTGKSPREIVEYRRKKSGRR